MKIKADQAILGLDRDGNGGLLGASPYLDAQDLELISKFAAFDQVQSGFDQCLTVFDLPGNRVGVMAQFEETDRHRRRWPHTHVLVMGTAEYAALAANPFALLRKRLLHQGKPSAKKMTVLEFDSEPDPTPPEFRLNNIGMLTRNQWLKALEFCLGPAREAAGEKAGPMYVLLNKPEPGLAESLLSLLPLRERGSVRFTECVFQPDDRGIDGIKQNSPWLVFGVDTGKKLWDHVESSPSIDCRSGTQSHDRKAFQKIPELPYLQALAEKWDSGGVMRSAELVKMARLKPSAADWIPPPPPKLTLRKKRVEENDTDVLSESQQLTKHAGDEEAKRFDPDCKPRFEPFIRLKIATIFLLAGLMGLVLGVRIGPSLPDSFTEIAIKATEDHQHGVPTRLQTDQDGKMILAWEPEGMLFPVLVRIQKPDRISTDSPYLQSIEILCDVPQTPVLNNVLGEVKSMQKLNVSYQDQSILGSSVWFTAVPERVGEDPAPASTPTLTSKPQRKKIPIPGASSDPTIPTPSEESATVAPDPSEEIPVKP